MFYELKRGEATSEAEAECHFSTKKENNKSVQQEVDFILFYEKSF